MQDPDSGDAAQVERVTQTLEEATKVMASAEMELEAKGLPSALARIAVSRAQNIAQHRVSAVSLEIRPQAFLDTLRVELVESEEWAQRQLAFLNKQDEKGGDT